MRATEYHYYVIDNSEQAVDVEFQKQPSAGAL